ncbi:M3 family metallopeptidase [Pseudomonas syringae]|uniref:M3 family metallopeptidase n=1 Tax=Pseudomonas syringae TaxID=317 RepID=UPI0011D148E2|nr:M3 family metallopeptidase [Pseudomonas syringae]
MMIVRATSNPQESARQLRDCLLRYHNDCKQSEQQTLGWVSREEDYFCSILRASYLLHAWLTYNEAPSADLREVRNILESAERRRRCFYGFLGSRSDVALESGAEGSKYHRLQALKAIEINSVMNFGEAALKEKLRLMVQLRKVRDEQAKIIGFESYFDLREQYDLSADEETICAFLGGLDEGIRSSSLGASVMQNHTEEYRHVDDFMLEHSLAIEGAFQLIEQVLKNELGLNVQRKTSLDSSKDTIVILEISIDQSVIGHILYDLRASCAKPKGNRTIAIACNSDGAAQAQLPIALCSCNVGTGRLLSFGMLISVFHELGHALDHLLDPQGGLPCRAIDELEVASRYMETLLVKSVENGTFANVFPLVLTKRYRANIRMTLLRQHVWETPIELLSAYFDLNVYTSPAMDRVENVAKVFERARAKITTAAAIPFESMLRRFDVASVGKYQCATHAYLWSHSFSFGGETSINNTAGVTAGGLHASLTKNARRNAWERSSKLLNSLVSI